MMTVLIVLNLIKTRSEQQLGSLNIVTLQVIGVGPVFKKADPSINGNYSGIIHLSIAYRILSNVMCERLKPIVAELIEP